MEFLIYKVSAMYIIKAVVFYNKCMERKKKTNANMLSKALNTSIVNSRNAIKAAEQLELLKISYKFTNKNLTEQKLLFRQALQSYKPFNDFLNFLYNGETPNSAIKMIKSLYNLNRNEKDLMWILKNWGCYSGIFKNKRGKLELLNNIKVAIPNELKELFNTLNNEIKARIWVKKILEASNGFLSQNDFDNLVFAMINFNNNPRESIKRCGETLEDILRKIAYKNNINVSSKNGISQISQKLRSKRILANKHVNSLKGLEIFLDRNIFDGFSAYRNMSVHGIDKHERKRWDLSSELALTYVIQTILCIRSLYYWIFEKKLIF